VGKKPGTKELIIKKTRPRRLQWRKSHPEGDHTTNAHKERRRKQERKRKKEVTYQLSKKQRKLAKQAKLKRKKKEVTSC